MKDTLYFIAIVPETEIISEVKAFQQYALENFHSGKALKAPPHITLEPPIEPGFDQLLALENGLEEFASKQDSFSIQLENFSTFPQRVIFVDVIENQKLQQLQEDLKALLRSGFEFRRHRPDRPFHPHMTVAFRDLRKQMFPVAWAHFRKIEYRRTFTASGICLLRHNGSFWEERQYFDFK